MMRLRYILLITLVFIFGNIWAQDSGNEVFAPFVSRINVSADTSRVTLSWKNSADLAGYKQIFRSPSEINGTTIKDALMIARVAPDVESYIDTPPSTQNFYYAVLIEDKNGDLFKVFIPYRNITTMSVRLQEVKGDKDVAAGITGISTEVIGDTIVVHFTPSNKTRELILYRSTVPLQSYADLMKAAYSIVLNPGTDSVKDVPVAGIDYYYAVLDALSVGAGNIRFSPGQNTTIMPVQIKLSEVLSNSEGLTARTYPLPAPHIPYNMQTGEQLLPPLPFLLPHEVKMKRPVQDKIDELLIRMQYPQAEMVFEFLSQDEAANLQGEQQLLQSIVVETLQKGNYKEAVDKLGDFLRTHHEIKVESRARFYLGQACFFRGQYHEALIEFVFSQELYYNETQAWIDACLEKTDSEK